MLDKKELSPRSSLLHKSWPKALKRLEQQRQAIFLHTQHLNPLLGFASPVSQRKRGQVNPLPSPLLIRQSFLDVYARRSPNESALIADLAQK